jgi:zinc protease
MKNQKKKILKNSIHSVLKPAFLFFLTAGLALTTHLPIAFASDFSFEKDSSLPLVYLTIAFKGGSTQDPDGKNGVTDLMGKLMLRGTKSKTKQQIDLALDQLGASMDVETHAEFISLRASVLSENLKPFLQLLSEIIDSPSFRAQELDKLKKEQVSNLLEDLNQDRSLVRLRFDQTFFKGHPYSKSNDGRIKDIQSLTPADITQQYNKLVHDNQMVVLAAGDSSENAFQDFLSAIKKNRGDGNQVAALPEFNHEPQKLRVVIFDKPDRTQTQVLIGQKGIPYNDPNLDALQIANYAFGGGSFQSKLMVELRVKRGWTYGAGSGFKLASRAHTWKVSFFPKNADTPAAIAEALKLIRELKDQGISKADFDAGKQAMINNAGFNFNTPAKRLENKLTEKMFGLPDGYFRNFAKRIDAVTLDQVNAALKKFLTPDHLMVGIVGTAAVSKTDIANSLGIPERLIEVQDFQKE